MKYNTSEVAELRPDYLGFIFWEPSRRFFEGAMPKLLETIKKVGVFVDATVEEVLDKIEEYDLWGVQLHGNESSDYCRRLKELTLSFRAESRNDNEVSTPLDLIEMDIKIIKVFSIKDKFDFSVLEPYEEECDYYLFDTKGKLPGGNGYVFNWKVLEEYRSAKPYFLSGGIGLEEVESIKEFMRRPESKYCHAIDVNSRFEIEPGLKNIEKLKKFRKVFSDY